MTKLFDVQLPFFVPLWRLIALTVFTFGWAGLEYSWGNSYWALGFVILGLYLAHQFFIAFAPRLPDPEPNTGTGDDP